MIYETDIPTRVIYAYDNKCNLISAVLSFVLTIAFSTTTMMCLYMIDERYTANKGKYTRFNVFRLQECTAILGCVSFGIHGSTHGHSR